MTNFRQENNRVFRHETGFKQDRFLPRQPVPSKKTVTGPVSSVLLSCLSVFFAATWSTVWKRISSSCRWLSSQSVFLVRLAVPLLLWSSSAASSSTRANHSRGRTVAVSGRLADTKIRCWPRFLACRRSTSRSRFRPGAASRSSPELAAAACLRRQTRRPGSDLFQSSNKQSPKLLRDRRLTCSPAPAL